MLTLPPTTDVARLLPDAEEPDELVSKYDDLEQWPPSAGRPIEAGEEAVG